MATEVVLFIIVIALSGSMAAQGSKAELEEYREKLIDALEKSTQQLISMMIERLKREKEAAPEASGAQYDDLIEKAEMLIERINQVGGDASELIRELRELKKGIVD
ncbi:hypothetical protein HDE_11221 [Halotydeus destructor]|nr:hypothetical protein HDE_11221 [Halotydeus destructor]